MRINYFDLGPHQGYEIEDFARLTKNLSDIDIHIYGIEANPIFAKYCQKRFRLDNRIEIYNFAIGSIEGIIDLYLDGEDGLGSSIYHDKPMHHTKSHRSIQVSQQRFSVWLRNKGFVPKQKGTINILKANIEGAEWDLMQDLDQTDLFCIFDLFCGPKHNWGFMTDMKKVPSLKKYMQSGWDILSKHEIQVYKYIVSRRNAHIKNVIDMKSAIMELLKQE